MTIDELVIDKPIVIAVEAKPKPIFTLTDEQAKVVDTLVDWASDKKQTTTEKSVGGFAGVGKTITIKAIIDKLDLTDLSIAVASFTGKAVSVLKQKGISRAQTLHSLLYNFDPVTKEFRLVPELTCDVIFVDEASMVNRALYNDLLRFKKKLIWVGDMGQLEPIGDNPNLMARPDLVLTKIHRQAALSPIIQFSRILREGQTYGYGCIPPICPEGEKPQLEIVGYNYYPNYIYSCDQIICAFNKTRHGINRLLREHKGFTNQLEVGDRVICLKNNNKVGVYNGLVCTVARIVDDFGKTYICDLIDEVGTKYTDICMYKAQFGENKIDDMGVSSKSSITYWDYGYCITCHKAQGSEWAEVVVIEEQSTLWDMRRWSYTAATRASKRLVYCR